MIGNGIGEFKLAARKSSKAQIHAAYSIVIEGNFIDLILYIYFSCVSGEKKSNVQCNMHPEIRN